MKYVPARRGGLLGGYRRLLTPLSPEFSTSGFLLVPSAIASGAWVSANDPVAIPFRTSEGLVVAALGWKNGSSATTDSCDLGVYDVSWNRKVSTGGTARSGSSAWQWTDVTDTPLAAGEYYLVMSNNGTTVNNCAFINSLSSAPFMAYMGCQDSATDAYPLPDPLTNMAAAATFTRIPAVALATRPSW